MDAVRAKSWLRATAAIVVFPAFLSAPNSAQAQPPTEADQTLIPYAGPPVLAQIAPGRTIHLVCMGHGSPTVIFTAGLGNWSEIWRKVQPAVSNKTQVCAWDRAGFGLSSPSPEPQDVAHTTADLEKALEVSHIAGPYVLVGHSLGSYESLLFADHHPREVRGMVLVDPSFPDQERVIAKVSPITAKTTGERAIEAIAGLKSCAAKLKSGETKPGDASFADCTDVQDTYPAELQAQFQSLESDPARFLTVASTIEQASAEDSVLAINPRRNYADIPLIVLTAGKVQDFPPEAHIPPEAVAAWAEFVAKDWLKAHDDIAALSRRGQNLVVTGSSHYIHMEKPQIVIDAINQVVDDVRLANRH